VQHADFVGCISSSSWTSYDVLERIKPGRRVFLLNSPYAKEEVWDQLPLELQEQIIDKKLRFYVIDGLKVAREAGMGNRINTVMQTCFFAISGVLPRDEAIEKIKKTIEKTYGKKGADVVARNKAAVDMTLANLHEIKPPAAATHPAPAAPHGPRPSARLRQERPPP
jgi:pyruvate-ferredoxin/flavodoxin oxidoreductase